MAYTKYSLTPANNNAAPPDGAPEGMLPSAVNDTMRDMMAQIRDVGDGIRGGTYTMTAPVITGGSITGVALSGNTFTNPVITGGSINNTPIGASTANTGAFTTLSATGATTFSGAVVMSSTLSANGGATLGDASGDALTINSSAVSIPNGLNFDSNTFVIDATNNRVGVGTASPAQALHINGFQLFENAGEIRFKDSGGTQRTAITLDSSNNFNIGTSANGALIFINGSTYTERMRITSTGDVLLNNAAALIGTNTSDGSDTSSLVISGGGGSATGRGAVLQLFGNESASTGIAQLFSGNVTGSYVNIIGRASDSYIRFDTGGTNERMRITSAGNVGIGTSSPATLLQVLKTSGETLVRTQVGSNSIVGYDIVKTGSTTAHWRMADGQSANGLLEVYDVTNSRSVMAFNSSGNVGIGNTPTYSRLDIVDVKAGANFSGLTVWNNTTNATGVSSTINLPVFNGSAGGVIQEIGNSVDGYRLNIYQDQGSGVITFGTGGNNERMRITSTGTVGIGTSTITSGAGWTPTLVLNATSAALVVKGVNGQENSFGTSNGLYIDCLGNSTGTNNNIIFRNTSSNSSFSSTERMRIDSSGNVGVGTTAPACRGDFRGTSGLGIKFQETSSGNSNRIELGTGSGIGYINADAGAGSIVLGLNVAGTERMRITSGGEVYIAGTTDQGAYNLQCNGTGVWGAGAYVNGSDERIKDDITPLDSGLDVVAKLNPVTYKYKEDWSKDQSIQTGFIAQELLTALEGKNYVDGVVQQGGQYMSVAYQNIIPILTKAIQEQQAMIEELKQEVALLKSK